jgi:type IX secretion system PorP/SprF family membrane protein
MKRIIYISVLVLGFVFCKTDAAAQFFQQSSLYTDNLYLINPAAIGHYDYLRSSFSHRNQWSGLKGAPRSNAYTLSTPFKGKVYLGGVFLSDKEDLIERTSGVLTYAYRLQLDQKQIVFLGLSGGFGQTKLNLQNARVEDYSDGVLNFDQNNSTTFSANFGAYYKYDNLNIGLAFPNFAKVKAGATSFGDTGFNGLTESPMLHASYRIDSISQNINLTPMVVFRFAPAGRSQYDFSVKADYKNRFWLGLMMRQYTGLITMLGGNITDQLQIGYSYEFPKQGIAQYSSGTHEFMISLNLRALTAGIKRDDYKNAKRFLKEVASNDSSLVGPPIPDYLGGEKENISVADAVSNYEKAKAQEEALGTFKLVNSSGVLGASAKRGYYVVLAAHREKDLALKRANDITSGGTKVQIILNDRKSWYLITAEYTVNKEQAIMRALFFRKRGFKGAWVFINK